MHATPPLLPRQIFQPVPATIQGSAKLNHCGEKPATRTISQHPGVLCACSALATGFAFSQPEEGEMSATQILSARIALNASVLAEPAQFNH